MDFTIWEDKQRGVELGNAHAAADTANVIGAGTPVLVCSASNGEMKTVEELLSVGCPPATLVRVAVVDSSEIIDGALTVVNGKDVKALVSIYKQFGVSTKDPVNGAVVAFFGNADSAQATAAVITGIVQRDAKLKAGVDGKISTAIAPLL